MNKFKVIVGEVYKRNLKSVSFWLMIISPFIMIGVILGIGYFASGGFDDSSNLGLITKETAIEKMLPEAVKDNAEVKSFSSTEKAKEALEKEDIEAYLEVERKGEEVSGKLVTTEGLGSELEGTIQQVLNQYQQSLKLSSLKLTQEQAASLQTPALFTQEKMKIKDGKAKKDEGNQGLQFGISFILVILIFFVIISYASIIAQEVASEKGTRIMEVILSSTTAQNHFYGKITGILLVALTQFGIYVAAFGIAWPFVKKQAFVAAILKDLNLSEVFNRIFFYNILFFFFGVLAFSVLAALCGSLVSKTEDVPKAITPVTYLGLIGYLIGITIGTNNPQSIVVKVASFIPFLSSFTMPVRLASDTVNGIQLFISLGILIITTVILVLFSARMYKANVLVYSEGGIFKSLKQSFSIMKNESHAHK